MFHDYLCFLPRQKCIVRLVYLQGNVQQNSMRCSWLKTQPTIKWLSFSTVCGAIWWLRKWEELMLDMQLRWFTVTDFLQKMTASFIKKKLIILKSLQRKFILVKFPVKYSSKLIIYKNSRGRCFSKHLSRSVLLTLIRKFAWNNNEQLFLMVLFIVYYIYKPCIIAPNQVTCILAKIILLGIFYVYQ